MWFEGDFRVPRYGDVRGFVRKHGPRLDWLEGRFRVEYLDYDWALNGLRESVAGTRR
jgi:hypothetical protein